MGCCFTKSNAKDGTSLAVLTTVPRETSCPPIRPVVIQHVFKSTKYKSSISGNSEFAENGKTLALQTERTVVAAGPDGVSLAYDANE